MLQPRKILYAAALVTAFFILRAGVAAAETAFNPNLIISNEEMMDHTAMSLAEIQSFLEAKGGYLARYTCANFAGEMKSAAQIIYDAAANNYDCTKAGISQTAPPEEKKRLCRHATINPKLLIVLLQKEQSLIEASNPSQRALDWATGYGCPDGQACNERWRGFGKQVNSAALQFFDYVTNPQRYGFKAGNTYTVTNTGRPPSTITPANHATAALYNYTPHVYNGNFNFHNLWLRYFTFNYLDGSLLQVKGEPGVWLIQKGKKRPFLSRGALTSRFNINKVIQVSQADLDRYPAGRPIKFPQYSLVRSPRGTIFLLIDDQRRGFADAEAFRKLGYHPDEVISATWDDINAYEEIGPITATSTYPIGALLQDKTSGGVYYVFEGTKAPLWDASLLKTKYQGFAIFPVETEKLNEYQTVSPAIFSDGELLKSPSSPAVYVIANGFRHTFTSGLAFEELGYRWENILTVPEKILALYPDGAPLSEKAAVPPAEEVLPPDEEIIEPEECAAGSGCAVPPVAEDSQFTGSTSEQIMEYFDSRRFFE